VTLNPKYAGSGPLFSLSRLQPYAVSLWVMATALTLGVTIGTGKWLLGVVAFVAVLALLYPVQVALGAFVLLLPFDSIAAIGQADRGRTLTWFAGAGATLVLLGTGLITRRLKAPSSGALWWMLFIAWSAITSLWALNPEASWQRLSTAVALLGLYFASSCFRFTRSELQTIVGFLILGGLGAAIWTVYLFFHGEYADPIAMRASLMMGSRETNPNDLGMSLLLPISLSFGYFLSSRRWLAKAVLLGVMVATTLGLLVTMSRGAFVALLATLSVYLYRRKARWQVLVPLLVVAILLSFMPSAFFDRFQQATESGGSGRLDIWQVGATALGHYGLVGAGLENFPFAYAQYAGQASHFRGFYRDPHNVYLCVAVEGGFLGFLLFVGAIRSQLRAVFKVKEHFASSNVLLAAEAGAWGMLTFGLFGNNLWQKSFWFSWMLLAAAVSTASETRETVPEEAQGSPIRARTSRVRTHSVVNPAL